MKTDASLPELLDRVIAPDGTQILRELQLKLDKIIARHHQEMQKARPVRKAKLPTKPSTRRV